MMRRSSSIVLIALSLASFVLLRTAPAFSATGIPPGNACEEDIAPNGIYSGEWTGNDDPTDIDEHPNAPDSSTAWAKVDLPLTDNPVNQRMTLL